MPRSVVHVRILLWNSLYRSAFPSHLKVLGLNLRCLEFFCDRADFRHSLPYLENIVNEDALPNLIELGFMTHSKHEPWRDWLDSGDLVRSFFFEMRLRWLLTHTMQEILMYHTRTSPSLQVLRVSDREGFPLPEPAELRVSDVAPNLRYILWDVEEHPRLYRIEKDQQFRGVTLAVLMQSTSLRSRHNNSSLPGDWTDESVFDHLAHDSVVKIVTAIDV